MNNVLRIRRSGNALIYFVIVVMLLLGMSIATLSTTLLPLRQSTDHVRQYNIVEAVVISNMNYAMQYMQGFTEEDGKTTKNIDMIKSKPDGYTLERNDNGALVSILFMPTLTSNLYRISVEACRLNPQVCLTETQLVSLFTEGGLPIKPETAITSAGGAIGVAGFAKIINPVGEKIASLATGIAVPTAGTIQYQNNSMTKNGNQLDVSDYDEMFIEGVNYPVKDWWQVDTYNQDVFAQMFGLDYNETIAAADRVTSIASQLAGVEDELIYFDGQLDLSAHMTIGSADAPVFLIVNGALNLSAGVHIYGYVYVRGGFNSSASTQITGGLFLADSMPYATGVNLSGGNDINSNPFVLTYHDYSDMQALSGVVGEGGDIVIVPLHGGGIIR